MARYANALPSILAFLAADSAVAAATTTAPATDDPRIYGETVPENPIAAPPPNDPQQLAPAIVVASVPGFAEEVPVYHPRWEVRAYAPRRSVAKNVIDAAINALHGESFRDAGRGVLVSWQLAATPSVGVDPDGFYMASCFFDSTVQAIGQ